MVLVESLEDIRIRLVDERKKRRYPFNDKLDGVDNKLKYLKSQEPDSDNPFFRLAIIDYELGDLARAIVYSRRFMEKSMFRDGFKDKDVILTEGELAMADLLTQLYLLCLSLGWNWNDLRELGSQHLEERQKNFKRDGWGGVE